LTGFRPTLPDDSPFSSLRVIRAPFIAAKALEPTPAKSARPAAAAPGNAGKSWTEEEDQRLVAGFDAGTPVAALARTHERTTGAINSRLVKLGRLQASDKSPPA
jgi:hypothetical protein